MMRIRPFTSLDRRWSVDVLTAAWSSTQVVTPSGLHDAADLPGLVAELDGERVGLLTYVLANDACEVVTLNSVRQGRGVGTALLAGVQAEAVRAGCGRLWLVTTNDNTPALRFYQRRGWTLVAVLRDAITQWRELKPEIPLNGRDGSPLRHALEFEIRLMTSCGSHSSAHR